MNLANYRKLIAAAVGLVLMYAQRQFGWDLSDVQEDIVDLVIGAGTAFFVWLVPNTPAPVKDQP